MRSDAPRTSPAVRRGHVSPAVIALLSLAIGLFVWMDPTHAAQPGLSKTYQKMLESDPYDPYALRRLLEVSKSRGSLERLFQAYTQRVESRPEDLVAWTLLGHLRLAADDPTGAVEALERAASLAPGDARPRRAVAQVWRRSRRWEPMLRSYEAALRLTKKRDQRRELYEEAVEAALEAEKTDAATRWLSEYRQMDPRSAAIAMSSADLLTRFGRQEAALEAWSYAEQSARAQLSDRVVIWRRLGTLLEEMGRVDRAEAVWRRAIKSTQASHWSRPIFVEGLVRVYRRTNRLQTLIEELRGRARKEPQLRGTLASLHEELGQPDQALKWLEEALRASRFDTKLHERRIQILSRRDDLPALESAYRELIRAAPREARYGLQYAEELFRRGLTSRALKQLDRVTSASRGDPGVWQRAISLMMTHARGASRSRLRKAYERLIKLEPREAAHHIGLGEHHWEAGKRDAAMTAWRRLIKLGRGPGAGQLLYAEVLADHKLDPQARAAFLSALEAAPTSVSCLESAARWFGAQRRGEDRSHAMELWTRLLELGNDAKANPRAAARRRGARTELIKLWSRARVLEARLRALDTKVESNPEDLSSGLLVSQLRLQLGRLEETRAGLDTLARRFPEHLEILRLRITLALRQQALPEAVELLKKLARLDPREASESLHQAAQIAKALEDHQASLQLTEEALTLRPDDASGQARVGELRLGLGDLEGAASAWREALRMNPRDDRLRFKLASLYRDLGDALREERLLVELVRDASSNAEVQRAGRRLLNVAEGAGRLSRVERVLRPLALSQGRRAPVHRRLLVDLYLMRAEALAWELTPVPDAGTQLERLGSRALEILLAAVKGTDAALRARSLAVLRLTRPVGAVPALARILEHGDGISRLHAAVTLGFIGSDSASEALSRQLQDTKPLRGGGAAARSRRELQTNIIWALGRVGGEAARIRLLQMTDARHATHHPIVALALANHPHAQTVRALHLLAQRKGSRSRLAALWALAHIERDDALVPLAQALLSPVASEAEIALWALARAQTGASRRILFDSLLNGTGPAPHLLVRALVSEAVPGGQRRGRDPYLSLIDLGQLKLASGAPDPNALIASTVLRSGDVGRRALSLAFLEQLEARYREAGRGLDLRAVTRPLSFLTREPGLTLPSSWRLEGVSPQEREAWAIRLASQLEPLLLSTLDGSSFSVEVSMALDLLRRLAAVDLEPSLQERLNQGVTRLFERAESPHRAELWRVALQLSSDQVSTLVRRYGPEPSRAWLSPEREEEWVALAGAAVRCPPAQAVQTLGTLLQASSARIRLAAARSVTAEHEALVSALVDLLDDPVVEVARQAARALLRLDSAEAIDALNGVRAGGDPRALLRPSPPPG